MRQVTDVVSKIEPLKSKTFMASHMVFCWAPSNRPSLLGVVKIATIRQRRIAGTYQNLGVSILLLYNQGADWKDSGPVRDIEKCFLNLEAQ